MPDDLLFLYDHVIEQAARLQTFCSMHLGGSDDTGDAEEDIDGMISLLAKRDLLTLAATTRNFADAADGLTAMRSIKLIPSKVLDRREPPFLIDFPKSATLYQALSRVLHANRVDLLRTTLDYVIHLARDEEELFHLSSLSLSRARLEPAILLVTEQDGPSVLLLQRIVTAVCEFLNSAAEDLASRGIHVSHTYRQI